MALPIVARAVAGALSNAGKGAAGLALKSAGTPEVDIRMFGDKKLQRALNRLGKQGAKKVVRKALRAEAKRAKARVLQNLSGNPVQVRTGELRRAFEGSKIRSAGRRGMIRIGIELPSRDALGIASSDSGFYPYAVEYGHGNVRAYPYIRPAIDNHYEKSIADIGNDIGRGIEIEARK